MGWVTLEDGQHVFIGKGGKAFYGSDAYAVSKGGKPPAKLSGSNATRPLEQIHGRSEAVQSHSFHAAHLDAQQYNSFEEWSNPSFNSPGGRLIPKAARNANEHLDTPQDYTMHLIRVDQAKPSQTGDDYKNSSSKNTAESLRSLKSHGDIESVRREDYNPIAIDKEGKIIDGNHRHAAAVMNGDSHILALVAAGKGTGQVKNLREVYEALKANNSAKLKR